MMQFERHEFKFSGCVRLSLNLSEPQSEREVNLKVTLKGRSRFQVELLLNTVSMRIIMLRF